MIRTKVIAWIFVAGICVSASRDTFARAIYFGSEPEEINISQTGSTLLRFEKPVKTISRAGNFGITPADSEDPDYSVLRITPRGAGTSNVVFILSDGSVLTAKMAAVGPGVRADAVYDIKSKASLISRDGKSQAPFVTKIDLMKAMIRDDIVTGYKIEKTSSFISSPIGSLDASLIRTYIGKDEHGYVYRLENRSRSKKFLIDIRKLTLGQPNLAILSQVSRDILGSKGSRENVAFLRVVAKPASLYRRITLPISSVEKN